MVIYGINGRSIYIIASTCATFTRKVFRIDKEIRNVYSCNLQHEVFIVKNFSDEDVTAC